mmetsp:Transcript_134337/g.299512  ORF Transcript_134337/g.299512 Transcript_134337/m.299512 type:complete len:91 (-) Transcript_134337:55-327(-)
MRKEPTGLPDRCLRGDVRRLQAESQGTEEWRAGELLRADDGPPWEDITSPGRLGCVFRAQQQFFSRLGESVLHMTCSLRNSSIVGKGRAN